MSSRKKKHGSQRSSKMRNWPGNPLGQSLAISKRKTTPKPKPASVPKSGNSDPLAKLVDDLHNKVKIGDLNLSAAFVPGGDVVRIYRANHTYARVTSSEASLADGITFNADFDVDGDHWDKLRKLLVEAVAESAPSLIYPEPSSQRIVTELPRDLGDSARELAVEATATIRENFRTYRRRVILPDADYRLQFWPRSEIGGVLALPFEFAPTGGVRVHGRLCLRRTAEILPLAVSSTITDDAIGTAWVAALCSYAQYVTSAGAATGEQQEIPEHENAIRLRRRGNSAHVGAFMRRLPPGKKASLEARQRAARFHVELPEDMTWVSEHDRLSPSEEEQVVVERWQHAISLDQIAGRRQQAA